MVIDFDLALQTITENLSTGGVFEFSLPKRRAISRARSNNEICRVILQTSNVISQRSVVPQKNRCNNFIAARPSRSD
jgi:hypothetical protein